VSEWQKRWERNSLIPPCDRLIDELILGVILEPHHDSIIEFFVVEVEIYRGKLLGIGESKANLNMRVGG
jgi:hypothetical protein